MLIPHKKMSLYDLKVKVNIMSEKNEIYHTALEGWLGFYLSEFVCRHADIS